MERQSTIRIRLEPISGNQIMTDAVSKGRRNQRRALLVEALKSVGPLIYHVTFRHLTHSWLRTHNLWWENTRQEPKKIGRNRALHLRLTRNI